jgi:hypothetical protein
MATPSLFGIVNSNRDFSQAEGWGKNNFNSSFPVALCCYLDHKNLLANYIKLAGNSSFIDSISVSDVFRTDWKDAETFFSFEFQFSPYAKYVIGDLPRTDIVIMNNDIPCSALEIKLTAIPDITTCNLLPDQYGSELVVRPDTIAYLACSLASSVDMEEYDFHDISLSNQDYQDALKVLPKIPEIIDTISLLAENASCNQKPFLLQPIWKTIGKSPMLAENCLDVFVWSDCSFANFISKNADRNMEASSIQRTTRTVIWLYKMLLEIKTNNHFHHSKIIDEITYNTKNDKAFATSGVVNNKIMKCDRLENPIITKNQIKEIILGGGQNLLSPERRFDAIIANSPELFNHEVC